VRYHTEYDTLSRAGTLAVNCEEKVILTISFVYSVQKEISEAEKDTKYDRYIPKGEKLKLVFVDNIKEIINFLLGFYFQKLKLKVVFFEIPKSGIKEQRPSHCPNYHTV
jgi:hypothetical protein